MFEELEEQPKFKGFEASIFYNISDAASFAIDAYNSNPDAKKKVWICILRKDNKFQALLLNMLQDKNKDRLINLLDRTKRKLSERDELAWHSDISGTLHPVFIVYVKK